MAGSIWQLPDMGVRMFIRHRMIALAVAAALGAFRPNIALVTGYEFGKITTLNVGMRFSF